MDFTHNDDRRMLAETLDRFLGDDGVQTRAEAAETPPGYDRARWAEAAELGAIGALVGTDHGGFGGAGFDLMVVFEAVGKALSPLPFLSALMASRALIAAGDRASLVEAIVAGTEVVAFAHGEAEAGYDSSYVATTAKRSGDGWTIDGAKTVVRDAEGATTLLVSARTAGAVDDVNGVTLFLVPVDATGVEVVGYRCVDGGRAAEVRLTGVSVGDDAVIGNVGGGAASIGAAIDAGLVALSAEALGAMGVVRDTTLDYLRTRVQFGEPIGRNQALQHRMATILIEIEQARSAVINAAAALDGPPTARDRALAAAKYTIGRTGTFVAEEAIQLHGGIGMTWELGMTHFAKRLMMINHQLGDDDHHLARFAALGRAA